ncbi:MAG: ABC transporter permease, partial [Anaerolineae bacterium]|nr:ABC transporter permease [Anaerolineae bacterium]
MGVPLALRNLLHERGKLLLSVVGIAAALALVLLLVGFRDGMYDAMTAYYRNLGADLIVAQSTNSLSNSTIPDTLHDRLVELSGATVADHVNIAGIIFNSGGFKMAIALVGYNLATGVGGPWSLESGRNIQAEDEVVLDKEL